MKSYKSKGRGSCGASCKCTTCNKKKSKKRIPTPKAKKSMQRGAVKGPTKKQNPYNRGRR